MFRVIISFRCELYDAKFWTKVPKSEEDVQVKKILSGKCPICNRVGGVLRTYDSTK